MKFILNIFILLIICFSATILPFNDTFYTSNLKIFEINPFKKEVVEVTTTPIAYESNAEGLLFNPSKIEFTMFSDFDKASFKIGQDHDLLLRVNDYSDNPIATYRSLEFLSELVTDKKLDNELSYILDISNQNLKLELGEYRFYISSTSDSFKEVEPVSFSVSYTDNITYQSKQLRQLKDKEEIKTLYYPNNTLEYLIPVTRIVKQESNIYRGLMNALQTPPTNPLLYQASPIPQVSKIWVQKQKSILYIHLPYNIGSFNEDQLLGTMALKTLLENAKNYDGVKSIRILRGDKYVNEFLAGNQVKNPINLTYLPRYYMVKKTMDNNVVFIPKNIETTFDVKLNYADFIFKNLQAEPDEGYVKIIPDYISLYTTTLEGSTLVLNFNEELLSSFDGNSDMQRLMIDSMLYSFTTIPGVDSVKINVEDKVDCILGTIDLSQPLKAPTQINIMD